MPVPDAFTPETVAAYTAAGHWDARTITDLVRGNPPDAIAFHAPDATLTWREYDDLSSRLAASYVARGWHRGDRLAVMLTGGALTHVAYLAAQKAGLVTVGLGPRAGDAEVTHVLRHTGAVALATRREHRGRSGAEIAARAGVPHLDLDLEPSSEAGEERGLGPDELFFINSTSGTTGLPKCVGQTMNIRKYFGPLAHAAAGFGPDEVMASVLPAPYGFGLWSAHVVPALYGFPTVLSAEFDAGETLRLIERHRVTVLAAVTSQFVMLLNHPDLASTDLSSLRVLFTGGERVPYERAAEFERRTGCSVLQFYGSNEAGPISVTTVRDPRERRLRTSGRPVDGTEVRFSDDGQIAVRGPGCAPGYIDDEEANRRLFTDDGWMRTGDLGSLDPDGWLTLTGRAADFIIRGGHNVSAPAVEAAVGTHAAVAQVAVVGVRDDLLGERACAYVVARGPLTLDDLRGHLAARGVSKQDWPEYLVVLPELPLGPGGKVDKGALRARPVEGRTFPHVRGG